MAVCYCCGFVHPVCTSIAPILGLRSLLTPFRSFSLQLILAVLVECGAFNLDAAAGIGIVIDISWSLGSWLLFFIVVYVLNTLLRQELGGAIAIYKVICLAITGVMLALACADAGISSYNDWTMSSAGYEANAEAIEYPWLHLLLAEYVLLLVGVLVSGALSLMTIFALRSRRLPGGVSALHTLFSSTQMLTTK